MRFFLTRTTDPMDINARFIEIKTLDELLGFAQKEKSELIIKRFSFDEKANNFPEIEIYDGWRE